MRKEGGSSLGRGGECLLGGRCSCPGVRRCGGAWPSWPRGPWASRGGEGHAPEVQCGFGMEHHTVLPAFFRKPTAPLCGPPLPPPAGSEPPDEVPRPKPHRCLAGTSHKLFQTVKDHEWGLARVGYQKGLSASGGRGSHYPPPFLDHRPKGVWTDPKGLT